MSHCFGFRISRRLSLWNLSVCRSYVSFSFDQTPVAPNQPSITKAVAITRSVGAPKTVERIVINGGLEKPLSDFSIHSELLPGLARREIEKLYAIQAATFYPITQGRDVIGRAKTGTGKTLAFVLPLLTKMMTNQAPSRHKFPQIMILAPTRELALQIAAEVSRVAPSSVRTLAIYGGASMTSQEYALRRGCDVLVGTPGRVMDMIRRKMISLDHIFAVTIDEADFCLDIGMGEQLDEILNICFETQKENRPQLLLFSATLPEWIQKTAEKYLQPNFVFIDALAEETSRVPTNIHHIALPFSSDDLETAVVSVMHQFAPPAAANAPGNPAHRSIIFAETRRDVDLIAGMLARNRSDIAALRGDMNQKLREQILLGYRRGRYNHLVATNVAARGLDITDVGVVVQMGLPNSIESFIHRVGRTARAGRSGLSVTFFNPEKDAVKLSSIENEAGLRFQLRPVPGGRSFLTGKIGHKTVMVILKSVASNRVTVTSATTLIQSRLRDIVTMEEAIIRGTAASDHFLLDLPFSEICNLLKQPSAYGDFCSIEELSDTHDQHLTLSSIFGSRVRGRFTGVSSNGKHQRGLSDTFGVTRPGRDRALFKSSQGNSNARFTR